MRSLAIQDIAGLAKAGVGVGNIEVSGAALREVDILHGDHRHPDQQAQPRCPPASPAICRVTSPGTSWARGVEGAVRTRTERQERCQAPDRPPKSRRTDRQPEKRAESVGASGRGRHYTFGRDELTQGSLPVGWRRINLSVENRR